MSRRYLSAEAIAAAAAGTLDNWRDQAACRGRARLMDPPPKFRTDTAIMSARSICVRCPVLDDCRAWVLGLSQDVDPGGVCAGLTENERAHRRCQPNDDVPFGRKRCGRCRQIKPVTDFYRDGRGRDGRQSTCKQCQCDVNATRYHAMKAGHA